MATYVETKIERALMYHMSTLVLSPVMSVAYPNADFTPPAAGYLRATHVPNTANQVTMGSNGKNRFLGLLQIDIMWPQNSGGYSAPMERAGAVAAHFKRGTNITLDGVTVRIVRPPETRPMLKSPPYVQVPVMIRYQADAANPS